MENVSEPATVSSTRSNPTWSVMIPAHNASIFIGDALESVLKQDPGPDEMEIIVVDDASDDELQRAVDAAAPGRVKIVRHDENRGAVATFNQCIRHATGRYVHILHADDFVRPGFYERSQHGFSMGAAAVVCRTAFVDEHGSQIGTSDLEQSIPGPWREAFRLLARSNRVWTPAVAVQRSVYESIGGFREALEHTADWEFMARVARRGSIWYEPDVLACYRMHTGSDTWSRILDGRNITERFRCLAIISELADEADGGSAPLRRGLLTTIDLATKTALELLGRREFDSFSQQMRLAGRGLKILSKGSHRGIRQAIWGERTPNPAHLAPAKIDPTWMVTFDPVGTPRPDSTYPIGGIP